MKSIVSLILLTVFVVQICARPDDKAKAPAAAPAAAPGAPAATAASAAAAGASPAGAAPAKPAAPADPLAIGEGILKGAVKTGEGFLETGQGVIDTGFKTALGFLSGWAK